MTVPFIRIEGLQKSYVKTGVNFSGSRVHVLKDICLTIPRYSCVGLVGESGSGKSTLARLLLGIEKMDAGEIHIDDMCVKKWRELNPGGMSAVFQNYTASINPAFRVKDALREPFQVSGVPKFSMEKAVELLETVGLSEDYLMRYPHELSGGECQRVCIARAIATKPQFLIFDEAVSALDVSIQAQIIALIGKLIDENKMTVLFISHDLQAVAALCSHLVFLKQGEVTASCAVEDLNGLSDGYARSLLDAVIPFEED